MAVVVIGSTVLLPFPVSSPPVAICGDHHFAFSSRLQSLSLSPITFSSRLQSLSLSPISSLPSARKLPSSSSRCNSSWQRKSDFISLCTNWEDVDAVELSALLAATRQNCEQFPTLLNDGTIVPVDPVKLQRALRHSTVVVALYVEGQGLGVDSTERLPEQVPGRTDRGWLEHWMPRATGPKTLVAFGRATSDHTLTASIYDLVVAPSHQRSGYGSRVLRRIVRDLRLRGISDIAAAHSPELRPFFQHCGFAPDTLKSVTMMYTRCQSSTTKPLQIKKYGRKSLLIPPPLRVFQGEGSHHLYQRAEQELGNLV